MNEITLQKEHNKHLLEQYLLNNKIKLKKFSSSFLKA